MPKDLAALLVEEGAVSAEALERALARQREAGGTLDTALLEAGDLAEDVLVSYLSRAAELPPAPPWAWSGDDARARRVFPSRVAERHGLAPFALEGRELSLVAVHPVDLALLDEISFMLSLHLTVHVGPEWRVRELIHRLYGTPLPPRIAALVAAAAPGPTASGAAPGGGAGGGAAEPPGERQEASAAARESGFGRGDGEPLEPLAAALAQALESVEIPLDDDLADLAAPASPGGALGAGAAEGFGRGTPEERSAPPDRSAPPRWTLEDARAALAGARDRDEVVLAALRYARDFFEFAAMFAVTRDAIAGHDALGDEDARERTRSVAIWASDPGTFRTAIETRSPHLGPFPRDPPGNEAILSALGRDPRTALVYPVLLRDRPVCVLYADNGEAPVSPRRLGDLLLFLSGVGGAFERIIRDRKARRRPGGPAARGEGPVPGAPSAGATSRYGPRPAAAPGAGERGDGAAALHGGPALREGAGEVPRAVPAPAGDDGAPAVTLDLSDLDVPDVGGAPRAEALGSAGAPAAAAPSAPSPSEDAPSPAALAERALDPDPAVAAAARDVLAARRRDPALRPAVEKLRRALLCGMPERAGRGARALGALRDVESIPLLIQVLETSEPEAARAAADALTAITLQRLGPDARRWLGWWKANRGRGRAEWLFSGLTSPDRQTRVAAAVELSLAAPPPVAYSADMPAAEREKAARAWAGWWSRSGHVL